MKLKDNISAIVSPLRTSQAAGQVMLRLTTAFTLGIVTYPFYSKYAPEWLSIAGAFLSAYVGQFVIDGTLDRLMPVAFSRFETEAKQERRFLGIVKILTFVLLGITGTITWYGLPEIAEQSTEEVDTSDAYKTIRALKNDAATLRAEQSRQLSRLEAAVRDAEKQGDALILAAQKSNPEFYRLMKQGNGWIWKAPELAGVRRAIDKAKKERARMVAAAQEQLNAARLQSAALVASSQGRADQTITRLASLTEGQIKARAERVENMTNVLFIIDVVLVLVVTILAYLIGLVGGHEIKDRKTSLGVLFEVVDARGDQFLSRVMEWTLPRTNKRNAVTPAPRNVAPQAMPIAVDEFGITRALQQIESKLQPLQRNDVTPQDSGATRVAPTLDVTDQKAIQGAIKRQRATLRSYAHKLRNGQGNDVTNRNGMKKAQDEITRLEKLLK